MASKTTRILLSALTLATTTAAQPVTGLGFAAVFMAIGLATALVLGNIVIDLLIWLGAVLELRKQGKQAQIDRKNIFINMIKTPAKLILPLLALFILLQANTNLNPSGSKTIDMAALTATILAGIAYGLIKQRKKKDWRDKLIQFTKTQTLLTLPLIGVFLIWQYLAHGWDIIPGWVIFLILMPIYYMILSLTALAVVAIKAAIYHLLAWLINKAIGRQINNHYIEYTLAITIVPVSITLLGLAYLILALL